ncbi:MAG: ParB N-terminal domain-containing protein [Synergistaceae bacterium]|jgi:ParB-like chromosome segregation protein Spo0J|nr:ParB N-terminal domain-containing protein [Synergistaceae bacterium]
MPKKQNSPDALEIVVMDIDKLKPADYNPRTISEPALIGLKTSIERFGLVQPIVMNKRTGNIVGGHQRVKALQAMGKKTAQVIMVDLPESEEKALNVTLNNPNIEGNFTADLGDILAEIKLNLDLEDFELLNLNNLEVPSFDPIGIEDQPRLDEKAKITCPECGHEFTP